MDNFTGLFYLMYYSCMPVMETVCVVDGSTTDCVYSQVAPVAVVDYPVAIGIAFVFAMLVAHFVRYAFYR